MESCSGKQMMKPICATVSALAFYGLEKVFYTFIFT